MTFHQSNLGQFGKCLPTDMDGYVHTTISGWMSAPIDWAGQRPLRAELREWARDKAAESRAAVKAAEAGLAEWRKSN
jgi:hypothetical protein